MQLNGEKIAYFRLKKGLTLKALSELSGVDAGTINRLEHGHSSPRPATAKSLCDALSIEFEDLFSVIKQPKGG